MHARLRAAARSLAAPAVSLCVAVASAGCQAAMSRTGVGTPFSAVGPGPLVIAHRGGSLEAPENTLQSVRRAIAIGSDWQEVDVTLSADGVPVVIHDDMLERTTDGSGLVCSHTAVALGRLDAGRPRWDAQVAGEVVRDGGQLPIWAGPQEPVPRLSEVLAIGGARLMIELKAGPTGEALVAAVVAAVHRAGAADRIALGSFDPALLACAHRLDPSLPLVGIVEEPAQVAEACALPIAVLAVSRTLLPGVLATVPSQVAVWTWTVYGPAAAASAAALGVHGVITDAPAAVLAALRGPQTT